MVSKGRFHSSSWSRRISPGEALSLVDSPRVVEGEGAQIDSSVMDVIVDGKLASTNQSVQTWETCPRQCAPETLRNTLYKLLDMQRLD